NKYYEKVTYFPKSEIYTSLRKILVADKKLVPQKLKWELLADVHKHPEDLVPEFYVIPKIHKNPVTTRPVVPEYNAIIKPISKYVNKILLPYVNKCAWILHNTNDLITQLESTHINM